MKHYVLYLKKCPGVTNPRHFKIGIAALESTRSRLATYQNAVGPVWEEAFLRIWVGDENQIRAAEKYFKSHFKEQISSEEAGLSEWICDVEMSVLLEYAQELKDEYFIKLVDPPMEFQPLSMPLCEDLQDWYINLVDTK